jgi:hypothetical protein
VGDRLSLAIEISDGRDVASVPFHVVFNPAVLRFEGGEEGTFLRSGGTQTTFFAAPTSGGDKVVVGLSMLGPDQGTSGDGLLCSLRFAVIGSGAAGLAFARAHVRDGRNRILAATFEAATITAR